MRLRPDGTGAQIFARGLRNSVGMDFAPWDGALYATDNGRDLLGDDFPPCELDRVVESGFYGWPYINGFGVLDPDLGAGHEALLATALPPVHGFRAHNAPLGIRFLRAVHRPPGFERAEPMDCMAPGTGRRPMVIASSRCTGATTARSRSGRSCGDFSMARASSAGRSTSPRPTSARSMFPTTTQA
jgi:hypothetical protein